MSFGTLEFLKFCSKKACNRLSRIIPGMGAQDFQMVPAGRNVPALQHQSSKNKSGGNEEVEYHDAEEPPAELWVWRLLMFVMKTLAQLVNLTLAIVWAGMVVYILRNIYLIGTTRSCDFELQDYCRKFHFQQRESIH